MLLAAERRAIATSHSLPLQFLVHLLPLLNGRLALMEPLTRMLPLEPQIRQPLAELPPHNIHLLQASLIWISIIVSSFQMHAARLPLRRHTYILVPVLP